MIATGYALSRPSTRDRLLRVLTTLAGYGIAAYPALGTDAAATRTALRRAILTRYPDALGSYLFWTAADESCFNLDGSLHRPLTLHHSGPDVSRAAQAALREVGLQAVPGLDVLTIELQPPTIWSRAHD